MKILVVRFKQIGDSILSSVVCNSLKKSFPDSQIDFLVYDFVAPLFKNHPYIDNVIEISKEEQKNPFLYLLKIYRITREKYDIIIDLMATPKSEFVSLFSMKTKYRIGRVGEKKKFLRGVTYNYKVEEPKEIEDECDKALALLKPLEDSGFKIIYDKKFTIGLKEDEVKSMRENMEKVGVDFSKPVYIFAVNSRKERKVYPVENMKKVVEGVLERYKESQIILFYSSDEKKFVQEFHESLKNSTRVFSNLETKSIRELASIIKNCDMFAGNEGGPRHLAQALDIPSLSIWRHGAGRDHWIPKSNSHLGISTEDFAETVLNYEELTPTEKYCLITPEYVLAELDKFMKKNNIKN